MSPLFFQLLFLVWFLIVHFIPFPPLNDIDKFPNSRLWNSYLFANWLVLILLIGASALDYYLAKIILILFLFLIMIGHICTWWLSYLFEWPKIFIQDANPDNKAT